MLISRQSFCDGWYVLAVDFACAAFEITVYLAWVKSTLVIINPFGEDDDDFEASFLKVL